MKKKIENYKEVTFKKAYDSLPKDDEDVINYDKAKQAGLADHTMAELELIIITKVINPPDFKPDFDNLSQYKWTPMFRYGQSGFRFLYSDCANAYSSAHLGSRLCFFDDSRAYFSGEKFLEVYKRFLIK